MPRIPRLDGLDELLAEQLCVVRRGQLLTLGMTDNAMQYRVRSAGPWQTLLPGVYLSVSGTPSPLQKQMGACSTPDLAALSPARQPWRITTSAPAWSWTSST